MEELKSELNSLKTDKRVEVASKLKRAKEFGDLSENAEYQAAKDEQANMERRIGDLEEIVRNVLVIKETANQEMIDIGSTIEVRRNDQLLKFKIVGSEEAKPEEGFISNESPLGSGLIGCKVGDSIAVDAPNGKIQYKVVKIG